MSIVKQIPKSDNGHGVLYTKSNGNVYQISNNPIKKRFTLWKVLENGYEKISTSDNPLNLYESPYISILLNIIYLHIKKLIIRK